MISTTEELYNMSIEELNTLIYKAVTEVMNQEHSPSHMGFMISDAIVSTRVGILKDNRFRLLEKGIVAQTKEEDRITTDISKAIDFWEARR